MAAVAECCRLVIEFGAEHVIPAVTDGGAKIHGTRDKIVDAMVLGLPNFRDTEAPFTPKVLNPVNDVHNEKIIIFTHFAKFHDHFAAYLASLGMETVCISGGLASQARSKAINDFKMSKTARVLIISGVGNVGIDLSFARLIICYVSRNDYDG